MPSKTTFTGPEICKLEAHEVVTLLRGKQILPAELLEASQKRTEQVDGHVNAMPTTCWGRAAQAVDTLDTTQQDHPGWLAGLPLGIKDLNAVEGVKITWGNVALAEFIPAESDPVVCRIEARGGLVIGKTNSPEFGAGGNTFNDVFGPTLNPYDTHLNAAGSSGGAAVQLATGGAWLSHGSDHGGSLRTPAAYNGIVGLRPSPGRVGGGGKDSAFMIEGVQGPMARSVTDCALFLDTMSGFMANAPISFPAPEQPYLDTVLQEISKPRIAWSPTLGGFGAVDVEVADHLAKAMQVLEKNGAIVQEQTPDITGLEQAYHTLRGMMWATAAKVLPSAVQAGFKQTLRENTEFGQALTIDDVCQAQINRSAIFANMMQLFENFDVLALPVVGCMPHPQSEEWVSLIDRQPLPGYMDWLRFAFLATTTGLPAMSVPVGLGPRGLPVGLQLIGRPRDEAGMLQVARFVEQSMGGPLSPIDPIVR